MNSKPSFFALTPLIFFVMVYLGLSLYFGDFYKVPITVAFIASGVYAIAITRGMGLGERIDLFSRGASDKNILLMAWIFVLAGAFAQTAKDMGAVDSTVNLMLSILPPQYLLPGLFLSACFISLAMGTSCGTIVALTPVAVGLAGQTDAPLAMIVAVVAGGSLFGDNLSFISDTTVVATQTQGCAMADKFRANSRIAFPAAAAVLGLYVWLGRDVSVTAEPGEYSLIKVLPYVAVIVVALLRVNVMAVLCLGIALAGGVGMATGSMDLAGALGSMGGGVAGMGEMVMLALLIGGLLALMRHNGGLDFITQRLSGAVKGKRGAELCIAAMVTLIDLCTANNTIAILTAGGISKDIAQKYGIEPKRAASLLDTFSCAAQGLIPYGGQLLMAAGLAAISPAEIIPYLFYPMALGLAAIVAIAIGKR